MDTVLSWSKNAAHECNNRNTHANKYNNYALPQFSHKVQSNTLKDIVVAKIPHSPRACAITPVQYCDIAEIGNTVVEISTG